jgi:hypothetical protein
MFRICIIPQRGLFRRPNLFVFIPKKKFVVKNLLVFPLSILSNNQKILIALFFLLIIVWTSQISLAV